VALKEVNYFLRDNPSKTVDEVLNFLEHRFNQDVHVNFLFSKFYPRKQQPNENIYEYAHVLQGLYHRILRLNPSSINDSILRDTFILNLFDNQLKLNLLPHINNKSSSFEEVKALAVAYGKRMAKIMQMDTGSSSPFSQQTVPPQKKSTRTILICDWCNKHGHVEKFCYSKDRYFKLKKVQICSQSTCDYKPGSTVRGRIKWFNPSSGYGFICLRNSDKDVFFHRQIFVNSIEINLPNYLQVKL
jgi:hypothetical protein